MWFCVARYRDEDGFTLVAVLGFILLFAMVLTPFALSARISALTAAHAYDLHLLKTTADTFNNYLAWRLASDRSLNRDMSSRRETSFLCAAGNLRIQITIQPHSGLINLNTADLSTLSRGFVESGLSIADAEMLAPQIIQYRMRSSGNEPDYNVQYGMKHSPFEDIVELHEWPLLQKSSLLQLSHIFSVGSGLSSGQPDFANSTNNRFTLQTDVSYHNRSVTAVGFFEISRTRRRFAKVGQIKAQVPLIPIGAPANCPGEFTTIPLKQLQIALP